MSLYKYNAFIKYKISNISNGRNKSQTNNSIRITKSIQKSVAANLNVDRSHVLNIGVSNNSHLFLFTNSLQVDIKNIKNFDSFDILASHMGNNLLLDPVYDIIVCAQAVLNDVDPMIIFEESHKILQKGGYLAIEFENSNKFELLFKKNFNKKAVFSRQPNNKDCSWSYSDSWISELCTLNKFKVLRKYKIHKLSQQIPSSLKFKTLIRKVPFFRNLASTTIFLCQKTIQKV